MKIQNNALWVVKEIVHANPVFGSTLKALLSRGYFTNHPNKDCHHCNGTGSFFQFPCYCRLEIHLKQNR